MFIVKTGHKERAGTAVVESAILLPLLVLVTFASIEACNFLYLKQSLTLAAFEGAMIATGSQGTSEDAAERCAEVLVARDVIEHDVSVVPDVDAATEASTPVSVTVTSPASGYSIGPAWFFAGKTVSAKVTMVRK